MKKLLLSLILSCFAYMAHAQPENAKAPGTQSVDPRIAEVFADQLQTLVLNDKDRLAGLNDVLYNRTEILIEKPSAGEKYPKLSSVGLFDNYNHAMQRDATGSNFDKEKFNILKYRLPLFSARQAVYRIDNTDYILVIHPQTIK